MPFNFKVDSYIFYDSSGSANGLARYSPVSLADQTEVDAANAAGIRGNVGEIVVQTPVSSSLATRRIVGIADGSVKNGQQVAVVSLGRAYVMANAAIAFGAIVQAAAAETRTQAQTPFTNNFEMMIPADPTYPPTLNLVLCDDTSRPSSGTDFYPVGYALKAASAKYQIIPVELDLGVMR